ncbi:phosphatase PAP2 family protein [Sphingomonas sp. M1-B02]|uniref:phosphatase PAP2 family protein n=1 Tax=Sphingomonas sp. M1-B02 TaxID=3114300 RepID=UPI00223EA155|nr:phosphatase PAP2 family protein [Sphingomonas sp. S6-11]UZK66411.1 phosphatase PAP2 family protein [Sphingomonas sp. S6-11]
MIGRSQREAVFTGTLFTLLIAYTGLTLWLSEVGMSDYLTLLATYLCLIAPVWILVALIALALLFHRRNSHAERTSLRALVLIEIELRRQRDGFLSFLSPPLIFALLLATFNLFKQRVLPQAGFGLDPALAGLDRMLFAGIDPWRITHAVLPSPWITFVLDSLYHGWFLPMSVGVMLCSFLPATADALRYRYLISFFAVWILLGSGLAALLPAAGPCFQPTAIGLAPGFEPLFARLQGQQNWISSEWPMAGLSALEFQHGLLELHDSRGALAIGGGISAMPSLHNALAALFAMAAFQIDRRAGWVMTIYAALIWIGSIHLGWHYAVDGPVAVAATAAIWWASGRVVTALIADGSERAEMAHC